MGVSGRRAFWVDGATSAKALRQKYVALTGHSKEASVV